MEVEAVRTSSDVEDLSINALRFLAVDAVQKANSGHPGMPMGTAAMAYTLWSRHLKHDPQDPDWWDRDRFVLSAGHGSMLLYGLLHLFGYDLPMDELKQFRQWGSRTPGHPENFVTRGVETTTGPLGQGFANGVGMAIAERYLAAHFNRPGHMVVDHHTYGIVSDGDLMEGISHEAASLAGHLGLGKLIYLYDDNRITIDGGTDLSFTEDVGARFESYGWHVAYVEDGNDVEALDEALAQARAESGRPSLLVVRTHIGYGSPNKQDTAASHGSPLGPDEVRATKERLGWPVDAEFHVPDEVYEHLRQATDNGRSTHQRWRERLEDYRRDHPELAGQFRAWMSGELSPNWEDLIPAFTPGDDMASRKASGKVLAAIGPSLDNLIGGSADLSGSNLTFVPGRGDHQAESPEGGYFHFGVREHGMGGICNGMALHGGIVPYCATFLVFSDYMRPSVRLAALMGLQVIYVFTHDSIGLGEDGPTHQPIEHMLALRAIPGLDVYRPADAAETAEAWRAALRRTDGPSALALSRQGLPQLEGTAGAAAHGVARGGYVVRDCEGTPDVILMGTGSELQLAVGAADALVADGVAVRVVSMVCTDVFDRQDAEYRNAVLPPSVSARVAVEAGVSLGWERYVGLAGTTVAMDDYGASAPAKVLFEKFGFTVDAVVAAARRVMA
ncbi:MAG: transketolase [Rhodothermales bacterium]|nr:transketolase [Rhodothermales bacterium]MBO6779673.1 transketolase [Rhodothermales bacterium]